MWERRLRTWSGLLIAVYVVLHFTNHILGLVSLEAMEQFRRVNALIWQNPLGTVALYGAFLVHFVAALLSLYRRTTLRMPAWEAVQLGLGLLIPLLLAIHVIGTRLSQELLEFDVTYPYVVFVIWNSARYVVQQPVLILVVWIHLIIGLHYWLRLKPWYTSATPLLYPLAVLIPVLVLLGFVRAGLEADQLNQDPRATSEIFAGWNSAPPERRELILSLESRVLGTMLALIAATLLARQLRRSRRGTRSRTYRIEHPSGRRIVARAGQSVLEALRDARVPHASVCGGRGRCTTCRVRINQGANRLPSPAPIELAALKRIGAAPNVRLACQTRPREDVSITPLLAANAEARDAQRPGGVAGEERRVAVMFIDLRDSTKLGEDRLPYDVVFILNQFFAEMSAALAETGGHYAQFSGDGLMALFGLNKGLDDGCRDAVRGAARMSKRLAGLNERLGPELSVPLRIGIGIHAGEAIVGTMGPPSSPNFSAIGDNINIAARLEAHTKQLGVMLVISEDAARLAGIEVEIFERHEADVRGRTEPVAVYAVPDPASAWDDS